MLPSGNLKPLHRPLYPEEIARNCERLGFGLANLTAYWPIWEGAGAITDVVGRNTISWAGTGTAAWGPQGFSTTTGTSDRSLKGTLSTSLAMGAAYTWRIRGIFVANNNPYINTLLAGNSDGNYARNSLHVNTAGAVAVREGLSDGAATLASANNVVVPGMLFDIAVTVDGTAVTIYVNGTQRAAGTLSYPVSELTHFGEYGTDGGANTYTGVWDQVAVLNTALTAGQVAYWAAQPYAILERPYHWGRVFVDMAAGGATIDAACADGVSLGDAAARVAALLAAAADGFAAGDAGGNLAGLLANAADGALLADAVAALAALLAETADGAVLSDAAAGEVAQAAAILAEAADGITLTDAALARADLTASASDGARLAEAIAATLQAVALAGDGFVASDLASWAALVEALAADGVVLSDTASRALAVLAAAADSVVLTDTGAARADFTVECADGVQFAETLAALLHLYAAVADGVRLADTAAGANITVTPQGRVRVTFSSRAATLTFTVRAPSVTFTTS